MVSVCMASFNGEKYIGSQIDSVLCQLGDKDELIISDDGSTDRTIEIIQSYQDRRIKLFLNANRKNIAHNFGNSISQAKGEKIFLCDQDDVWYNNKVSVCSGLLDSYDLVVSDCHLVNDNLEITSESYFRWLQAGPGFIKNFKSNTFLGCCMCFRSTLLPLILPFPEKIPMHDIWIGFIATVYGKVKFENQPLMMYRRHSDTVTHQALGRSKYSLLGKLRNRYNLIRYIPLLIKRKLFLR